MNEQERLVAALEDDSAYPHLVSSLRVVETHISWVILTGLFAYKIKKAVDLGFLDFSTLAKRKRFCEAELRLNRRWAPDLYLGLVPVTGPAERPRIGGDGPVLEYALKLRQFPQDAQLDRQLDSGRLSQSDMGELAETIATLHDSAPRVEFPGGDRALALVRVPMLENFDVVEAATGLAVVARIRAWTESSVEELADQLAGRHREGFVRDCHGDLHLANLVRLSAGIVPFDGIEFSRELREIDVINDIAFLAMDLFSRARQDLGAAFVNRYLECSGDYAGMSTFGLYFVYRCLTRAKVAAIRSAERDAARDRDEDLDTLKHYLAVAIRWVDRPRPVLVAMLGFSGSGKTWLSERLLARLPAIRLRTDIERRRLAGAGQVDPGGSLPGSGRYSRQARAAVYRQVFERAGTLLRAGFNVIIDAAFLEREARDGVASLAAEQGVDYLFVETVATEAVLEERLKRRQAQEKDASEADVSVLHYQMTHSDPLDEDERRRAITVATDAEVGIDSLVKTIRASHGRAA